MGDKEQSVCSQLEAPSCFFILCSDKRSIWSNCMLWPVG